MWKLDVATLGQIVSMFLGPQLKTSPQQTTVAQNSNQKGKQASNFIPPGLREGIALRGNPDINSLWFSRSIARAEGLLQDSEERDSLVTVPTFLHTWT